MKSSWSTALARTNPQDADKRLSERQPPVKLRMRLAEETGRAEVRRAPMREFGSQPALRLHMGPVEWLKFPLRPAPRELLAALWPFSSPPHPPGPVSVPQSSEPQRDVLRVLDAGQHSAHRSRPAPGDRRHVREGARSGKPHLTRSGTGGRSAGERHAGTIRRDDRLRGTAGLRWEGSPLSGRRETTLSARNPPRTASPLLPRLRSTREGKERGRRLPTAVSSSPLRQ